MRSLHQHEPQVATRTPSTAASTLYELLQVSRAATSPVIEAAYQALQGGAATAHAQHAAAGADGLELFRAYRILRDPARRAAYDLELQQAAADPAPTEVPEDQIPESEPASTTCWRCSAAVSAVARYCSSCHWLICDDCRACGCQNPDWRRERPVRSWHSWRSP